MQGKKKEKWGKVQGLHQELEFKYVNLTSSHDKHLNLIRL